MIDSRQFIRFIPISTTPYIERGLEGYISKADLVPSTNKGGKAMYKVEMKFPTYKSDLHDSSLLIFTANIKGNGQILISDKPIIKRILN